MNGIIATCCGSLLLFFLLLQSKAGLLDIISSYETIGIQSSKIETIPIKNSDTTLIEIKTKGIELSYSVPVIRVKSGSIIRIRYSNESDMSHNIVIVKTEADIRPVGIAALQAQSTEWVPAKEMNRIIAYSKLAHSGKKVEFIFKVPPPGTYPFICTYSAHWTQMQGRLISIK